MIDATLKHSVPPLALPAREFMERARAIWEELKLPAITARSPWYGDPRGDWADDWETFARRAVKGEWEVNGAETFARRRGGVRPETPVHEVEGK
jgi:4-hydroxy-3-polyprenylbenzoate decarboxylase